VPTNDNSTRFPLPLLPRRLHAGYTGDPPLYQRNYRDAINNAIPAEWDRGRWYVRDQNLPAIAAAYGLTPKAKVA